MNGEITFGTIGPNGITNVRIIKQSDIAKCPHFILDADHYREDGTCKCDDPEEQRKMIREWGYSRKDFGKKPSKQIGRRG